MTSVIKWWLLAKRLAENVQATFINLSAKASTQAQANALTSSPLAWSYAAFSSWKSDDGGLCRRWCVCFRANEVWAICFPPSSNGKYDETITDQYAVSCAAPSWTRPRKINQETYQEIKELSCSDLKPAVERQTADTLSLSRCREQNHWKNTRCFSSTSYKTTSTQGRTKAATLTLQRFTDVMSRSLRTDTVSVHDDM